MSNARDLADHASGFDDKALTMPSGTTAQRPSTAVNGMLRYSTTDNQFEGYVNSAWGAIGGAGGITDTDVTVSGSTFTLDFDTADVFNLGHIDGDRTIAFSNEPSESSIFVMTFDYTSGSITFPSSVRFASATGPTFYEGREYAVTFFTNGDGNYFGELTSSRSSVSYSEYLGGIGDFAINGENVTIDLTSLGLQQDDVVIAALGIAEDASVTATMVSSGWTNVVNIEAVDTEHAHLAIWYKVMGATPDTSVQAGPSAVNTGDTTLLQVRAFRGVDTTTPMDVTATSATHLNTAVPNPPSITTANDFTRVVAFGVASHTTGGASLSHDSGIEAIYTNGTNETTDGAMASVMFLKGSSGSINPDAFTFSVADSTSFAAASATIALRTA